MKIKKFFQDYGYTAVKLIVTHIAMSIFGLMLYLPTGGSPLLGGIFGIVSVIFYFFMINNDISKVGAQDAVRTSGGKCAAHPAKGFLIGAVSAIPDFIICGLYLFFWYFQGYEWAKSASIIFMFVGVLWEGVFMGLTSFAAKSGPIVFACIPFMIIIFAGVSYILGSKNINLIPLDDNAEDAERKRDAKKEKKKLFSFSKPEKQDEEDEDELM
jgi:hypothetical protein